MSIPQSVFEEFMSPLTESDAVELKRDSSTGLLIPTKQTAAIRTFKYIIRRGSVSDRLFHLQTFDSKPSPSPVPAPAPGVELMQIGERDVYEVEEIRQSRVRGKRTRE